MGFPYPSGNIKFQFPRVKVFSGFQFGKGADYSSIQNFVWACHFVSGRKIPTSLQDKCKRMT